MAGRPNLTLLTFHLSPSEGGGVTERLIYPPSYKVGACLLLSPFEELCHTQFRLGSSEHKCIKHLSFLCYFILVFRKLLPLTVLLWNIYIYTSSKSFEQSISFFQVFVSKMCFHQKYDYSLVPLPNRMKIRSGWTSKRPLGDDIFHICHFYHSQAYHMHISTRVSLQAGEFTSVAHAKICNF